MLEKAAAAMVLRWGIIGCGDVTEVKSGPAFQLAENSRLVAVMRRDGQKAKDYAERHNVPKWYNTLDGILTDPEVGRKTRPIVGSRFMSCSRGVERDQKNRADIGVVYVNIHRQSW